MNRMSFEVLTIFLIFTTTALLMLMNDSNRKMYVESLGFKYNYAFSLDCVRIGILVNLAACILYLIYAHMDPEEGDGNDQNDNHVPQMGNHVPHIGNHVPRINILLRRPAPNNVHQAPNNVHQNDNQIQPNDHLHQD